MTDTLAPARQLGTKPPAGAQGIAGHPLMPRLAFLFNEGSGSRAYGIPGMVPGDLLNSATFAPSIGFPRLGIQIPNASNGRVDAPFPDAPFITRGLTIVWKGYFESIAQGGTGFQHLAGKHAGSGANDNPFDFRTGLFQTTLECVRANASGANSFSSSGFTDVRTDQYLQLAVSFTDNLVQTSPIFTYNDQLLTTSASGVQSGPVTGTNDNIRIGQRSDGGTVQFDGGSIEFVYFYDRGLTADQLKTLYRDPYAWIRKPLRMAMQLAGSLPAPDIPGTLLTDTSGEWGAR